MDNFSINGKDFFDFKKIPIELNLVQTMLSGQPPHFIWNCMKINDTDVFYRMQNGKIWCLFEEKKNTYVNSEFYSNSLELFRATDNYFAIKRFLKKDGVLSKAISRFPSLRLTKSDFWETTICYLCSSNNNLARIKKMVGSLINENGQIPIIDLVDSNYLKTKGLGYRLNYIADTAYRWHFGEFNSQKVRSLNHNEAKNELMKLKGIGPKVADCISLYGLGNTESFPIDVWVYRAMRHFYDLEKINQMQDFANSTWGKYAGFAQHYLFWYARELALTE